MSFHYGQGYPGGGTAPPGAPYGGGGSGPYGPPHTAPYGGGGSGPYGPPHTAPYGGGGSAGGPYGSPGYGGQYGAGGGAYRPPYGGPSGNLPPGVNPEAYQWFQTVDRDRSGYINSNELKQALVNSNWSTFNEETCLMMINMFDKTKSGRINLPDFSALWDYLQQWRALFQRFDQNRSGSISGSELHQALTHMGYNLNPQFSEMLVQRFSGRGGQLGMQLDRFIQVCTQLQSMTQVFRERDTGRTGQIRLSYEDFLSGAVTRLM